MRCRFFRGDYVIYFDNAATGGKKPKSVINAVNYALTELSANPGRSGHFLSQRTADAVYSVRKSLSDFFGSDGAETVVFTQNCTHSINCVLKGVVKAGEHIVVSNLEHNAVMRPLVKMKADYSIADNTETVSKTLENFENAIKPNTKLIVVSGASNVTGEVIPYYEIGKICKKHGIRFCVDAAQIAGVLPIDMKKYDIDYLCIAPHKGLYAPMGIGVLICRAPIENTIIEGGTGTDSLNFAQPKQLPEALESGTVNVPAVLGVGAGTEFVKNKGIENIYKHEFLLLKQLYEGLRKNKNIILYTNSPRYNFSVPVLSFNYKGCDSHKTASILNDFGVAVRAGLHCAATAHKVIGTLNGGTVRVSLGVFNNMAQIEKFVNILNSKKFAEKT